MVEAETPRAEEVSAPPLAPSTARPLIAGLMIYESRVRRIVVLQMNQNGLFTQMNRFFNVAELTCYTRFHT